jgi:hypothetical protein
MNFNYIMHPICRFMHIVLSIGQAQLMIGAPHRAFIFSWTKFDILECNKIAYHVLVQHRNEIQKFSTYLCGSNVIPIPTSRITCYTVYGTNIVV